ncbi:hypothetical protein [Enterobacter mori]|uniref:hypothetical protein n=1 Tax=Enterobacter mori TaxID=539813 RepID=UPI003B84506D
MPLPTNEFLLALTDMLHNELEPGRAYNTVAIGVVGHSVFNTRLVAGINSATFHPTRLTSERTLPQRIRTHRLITELNILPLREPYHAETSVFLYAKENNMKIYGLASSRRICPTCCDFMLRYRYLMDDDCFPVDGWANNSGVVLNQRQRMNVLSLQWYTYTQTKAIREPVI